MIGEINYAVQNLINRKTRSWLTVLSILMGITAIFALLSFGYGMQAYIDELASEAGADKLYVQAKSIGAPGTDANFFISKKEFEFIKKIKGVDLATGMYLKVAEVSQDDEKKYVYMMGTNPDANDFLQESFGMETDKGRGLKDGDLFKAVIGYNYQFEDKIFEDALDVGDKIEINGKRFDIVGIFTEIGNAADDANIYITQEAMELLYPEVKDKYAMVMLQAQPNIDPEALADDIQEELREYKGQEEGKEDFFVQTFGDLVEQFSNIISIINGVLFLIAFISIIVAFVNIMNTMYTSVLERTKEIGVMKAIGAKNSTIVAVFVIESGLLGLIGGLMGLLLGYIIAKIGGFVAASAGYGALQPVFPLSLIISLSVFSFAVGAIAGLLPARQASQLRPVDALRYE